MSRTSWIFTTIISAMVLVTIAFLVSICGDLAMRRYQKCLESGTQYMLCTDPRTRGW